MSQQVWTREQVRQVLHELSQLPDFDLLPIPESIAKEYNIPFTPAKTLSINQYLVAHKQSLLKTNDGMETRVADGIVRETKQDDFKIYVCKPEEVENYIIKKNDDETHEQPNQSLDTATESDTTTPQQS
jgi:hypothetical protein